MRYTRGTDTAIAAVLLGATLAMLATRGFGTPEPDSPHLDVGGALLAALTTLPLAVHRRGPALAYAVIACSSVLLLALGYPLDLPFGAIVAVYLLAVAYAGGPDRRIAFVAVWALVPVIVLVFAARGLDVVELLPAMLGWSIVFGGAWVSGDRTQLRAAALAEMRERAERAEREAVRERRLAAAEERTRIARELHDSAGHAINVILVQAGAARLLQEQDPDRSREALGTIEHVARETIGEIDRLVRALREDDRVPADPGALTQLVEQHRGSGLQVAASVEEPPRPVPRSVAWAAYRIVQEALTNAARHGVGRAELSVRFGDDAAEIDVRNPARADAPDRGGHGIVGMRERATLLGGTLEAAADGDTFRLHALLPYGEVAA